MSDQEKDKLVKQLKDALVAIRKLKTDLKEERLRNREPLAIIGMSMRFPGGVKSAEDFWELLYNGKDAITDIPSDRFNAKELYDPQLSTTGKINVKQGGFIDDVDRFDSSFFDITPVEIESMDPQQRILLELAHEAMENAGLNVQELVGSNTGVYVGIGSNDYQVRHFHSGDYNLVNPYSYTGSAGCAVAGRLSYIMGFQGPSMSIDTACSASIVAAHVGSSALRNQECDMAVIGGVNLMLSPEMTICFSNLQALSPDSRCKTFDNSANGYVRSEGSGVMVLKRLSDARRDGDRVMAVIKGSAANQDGRSNGFTAPNVLAQIDLIKKALADAGLTPEDIDYIEAHGTGTKIGDPIEVEALSSVFKPHKSKDKPLLVGSVKSNIGHLESAAGMASMIKAVLSLQHDKLPQSIHYHQPNELINWKDIPIQVASELMDFKKEERNIGISGFGITGTNGHIIIGDAPLADDSQDTSETKMDSGVNSSGLLMLPLSAKSPEALSALAGKYSTFIESGSYPIQNICSFTALKRAQMDERKLYVANDRESLLEQLLSDSQSPLPAGRKFGVDDVSRTVFVFSGQGAQWPQMGLELAKSDDVFRTALEACNGALSQYVDWDVFEELGKDEATTRLKEGDVMQPLLMAIGVALAKWWMSKGIHPDKVVGHSMGEIAAAHIGGHISLDEAARIITSRSRLMEAQAGKGMMLATDLTVEEAEKKLEAYSGRLSVSVMNSSSTTVIGGETNAIEELLKQLEGEDRWCRRVKMTVAAHTVQMDPVLEPLRNELSGLNPQDGPIGFYSSSQNRAVPGSELNADYWVKNVRNSVKFGAAIRELADDDNNILFLEIGPHTVLTAAIEDNILEAEKNQTAAVVSSFYRNKDEVADLHQNLGELYRLGIDIDWSTTHAAPSEFLILPNYPWQRERFWFDEEPSFRSAGSKSITKSSSNFYHYEWNESVLPKKGANKNIQLVGGSNDALSELSRILEQEGHQVASTNKLNNNQLQRDIDLVVYVHSNSGEANDLINDIQPCLDVQEIIRMVTESTLTKLPELSILTNRVFASPGRQTDTSGSMLWGMARTLRNEYPELGGQVMDADAFNHGALARLIGSGDGKEFRVDNGRVSMPLLVPLEKSNVQSDEVNAGACFLVTGGTSGLGLAFAEWLSGQSVERIALVSRSGEKKGTAEAIERMEKNGVQAKVFKADISNVSSLSELIASVEVSLGRITGVVHAAGLVDDGTISSLTPEQFLTVSEPKISGTWNLHEALQNQSLTHFIAFSSAATVLGTVGQANYNAANFYIDQLMHWRKEQGLVATAVNWGNIGGVGMAAEQENRGERFETMGFSAIQPTEFDHYFSEVFQTQQAQIIPMKMDFSKWAEHQPGISSDPTFAQVLGGGPAQVKELSKGLDWGSSLSIASKKIKDIVKIHLAGITGIETIKLKEGDTFKSMGLDSMMALQLRNKIQEATRLNLAVSSIWAHPTIEKYASFVIDELSLEDHFSKQGSSGESNSKGFSAYELKEMVKQSVAGITKLPANRIKETDTFKSMGIDSMQALQIKNTLQSQAGVTLAASSIWAHPTIEKYASFLEGELQQGKAELEIKSEPQEPVHSTSSSIEAEVDELSLDELMKQLEDKSNEY